MAREAGGAPAGKGRSGLTTNFWRATRAEGAKKAELEAELVAAARDPENAGSHLADADWIEEYEYEEVYAGLGFVKKFFLRNMVATHRAVRKALREALNAPLVAA